ncbi:hypothetical protein FQN53_006789 [Emmonsiellopsis sp. PD_33]|nr:hypothetical protein FQN53_006789 [Emmonsiellopsis sp. PD_33]
MTANGLHPLASSRNASTQDDKSIGARINTNAEPNAIQSRPPDPPPNGGSKAWLQVVGTMLMFGAYQAYYERGDLFKQTSANISWVGSCYSFLVFGLGAVVGPIYDRGYLKLLMIWGAFCMVLGHMMLSLCQEYWQVLLSQGVLVGIGGCCLFVPALAVLQLYFSSHLGLAVAIAAIGSSVGGVLYPVVFINLIDRIGFGWTTRTIGFIILATLAVPIAVSEMRTKPPAARKMLDVSAFTDGQFMLCALGCVLGYAGCQMAWYYTAFFGQANGWLEGNFALYLVSILNTASAIGRVVPNLCADRFGAFNTMVAAVHSAAGVICTSVFFGFLSGLFVATPPLLFMLLTKDKSKLGSRMGMAYTMLGFAVFPGGPGAGAVLRHDKGNLDWVAAWAYSGALLLAALLVFCVLRLMRAGTKVKVKV